MKRYTPEEFEEIIKKVPEQFAKSSIVRKDLILREIFSNFYFGNEKIVGFSVKEPFASLLNIKTDDILSPGGGWEKGNLATLDNELEFKSPLLSRKK